MNLLLDRMESALPASTPIPAPTVPGPAADAEAGSEEHDRLWIITRSYSRTKKLAHGLFQRFRLLIGYGS